MSTGASAQLVRPMPTHRWTSCLTAHSSNQERPRQHGCAVLAPLAQCLQSARQVYVAGFRASTRWLLHCRMATGCSAIGCSRWMHMPTTWK